MKKYIFLTTETYGHSAAPNGEEIDNVHLLGIAEGKNEADALINLLRENDWIVGYGYNTEKIYSYELA